MLLIYLILVHLTSNTFPLSPSFRLALNIVLLIIGTLYLFAPGLLHFDTR